MAQLRFLLVPLVIIAFNATFMLIMRGILLSFSKEVAPFVALAIAATILGGAAYLARSSPRPDESTHLHSPH